MKIAIVSFEFEGLTKNGGIGTSYRRMAELLVEEGHSVTIVFMPFEWQRRYTAEKNRIRKELMSLYSKNIRVVFPEFSGEPMVVGYEGFHNRRSLQVYEFLKQEKFDVVHAPDNCGLVYQSLLARKAGLSFKDTKFIIGLHGAPFWTAEANGIFTDNVLSLSLFDQMSIEMADAVVSPSAYMVNYLRSRGWVLPSKVEIIPNVNLLPESKLLRKPQLKTVSSSGQKTPSQKTLVFFGRLERRKGIFLFVDALQQLFTQDHFIGLGDPVKIVFLGSEARTQDIPSVSEWIKRELSYWPDRMQIEFMLNCTSEESLEYLSKHRNSLVCMPSLVDNSPYTILECIERGLDFLGATVGGQGELMSAEDAKKVLVEPKVSKLVKAIRLRLKAAPIVAKPSKLALSANKNWIKFHDSAFFKKRAKFSKVEKTQKRISIVIGAHRVHSFEDLYQSVRSVLKQTYKNIELIAPAGLDLKLGRSRIQVKRFGRSDSPRKAALQVATGELILFLDGGCLLKNSTLAEWVNAAKSSKRTDSKLVAFHGIVKRLIRSKESSHFESIAATPVHLSKIMTGTRVASSFALFETKLLKKIASKCELDLSSDTAARPIYAHLLALGYGIASFPLEVVQTLGSRYEPSSHARDHKSVLDAIWSGRPSERVHLSAYVAGLHSELDHLRSEAYHTRLKLMQLENMRQSILRSVQ